MIGCDMSAQMNVAFLLGLLQERHLIDPRESQFLLSRENEVRKRLFKEKRDEFAGRLANANNVHPVDVVLNFDLFQEAGRELDESKLAQFIADKKNVPLVHIDPLKINAEVLTKFISRPFARKH